MEQVVQLQKMGTPVLAGELPKIHRRPKVVGRMIISRQNLEMLRIEARGQIGAKRRRRKMNRKMCGVLNGVQRKTNPIQLPLLEGHQKILKVRKPLRGDGIGTPNRKRIRVVVGRKTKIGNQGESCLCGQLVGRMTGPDGVVDRTLRGDNGWISSHLMNKIFSLSSSLLYDQPKESCVSKKGITMVIPCLLKIKLIFSSMSSITTQKKLRKWELELITSWLRTIQFIKEADVFTLYQQMVGKKISRT